MKLLWLASWFPSRVDATAGDFIERHAEAVAPGVSRLDVFHVVRDDSLRPGQIEWESEERDAFNVWIAYYRPPQLPRVLETAVAGLLYMRCFQLLWKQCYSDVDRPDLIHVHVAMRAGLIARYWSKRYRIPYLVTEHWTGYYPASIPTLSDMPMWYRTQTKRVLQQAKLLMPVSADLGEKLKALAPQTAIEVVPNVVNTSYFHPPQSPRSDWKRFVHFSYLNEQKNPAGMLDAINILRDRGCSFRFDFYGAKSTMLAQRIQSEGLADIVRLHDAISYRQVAIELQSSTALVMFSRFENQPCVILESLCVGVPVITTPVGGIPDVVGEEQGIQVPVGNTVALADAMQGLLDHPDRFDSAGLSTKASQRYSYAAVRSTIIRCYQQLLGQV